MLNSVYFWELTFLGGHCPQWMHFNIRNITTALHFISITQVISVLECLCVDACVSATDLRWKRCLIMEENLTQRLLVTLVDISKPQHLFFIHWRKVQEGLIACSKVLFVPGDQQHAVPAKQSQSIHLPRQTKWKMSVQSDEQLRFEHETWNF